MCTVNRGARTRPTLKDKTNQKFIQIFDTINSKLVLKTQIHQICGKINKTEDLQICEQIKIFYIF